MAFAVLAMLGALALAPAVASAAIAGSTSVSTPSAVTVGQTGVIAQITVTNANSGPDTGVPNNLTGVTLLPACALPSEPICAPGSEDPGVFTSAPTAVGEAGTSVCPGTVFDVSTNPTTGELTLSPQTTVTLPQGGFSCVIDVVLSVVGMPVGDANPIGGIQTDQIVTSQQQSGSIFVSSFGSSETTVNRAIPTIATSASAPVVLGGALTDTATVSGRASAVPGATVEFRLFGPDDATCAAPIFTTSTPVSTAGTATSSAFTPTRAGTYRWIAFYGGDRNNAPAGGACNDPGESVTVIAPVAPPRATPTITVAASPDIVVGGPLSATATVGSRSNPVGGATVRFRLFGPGAPDDAADTACLGGPPAFTATVPLSDQGVATSPAFRPIVPGVYRWVATYNGDANNLPVASACGAPDATVAVAALPAQILSAGFLKTPRTGQLTFLEIAAFDQLQPISGVQVRFGEPRGLSGISACTLGPFGVAISPVRLRLPYIFRKPGRHRISIVILSGGCGGTLKKKTTTSTIDVIDSQTTRSSLAAARSAAGPSARASRSGCKNTFLKPTSKAVGRLKVATAILCLVNGERRKKGLKSLKQSRFLALAATGHSKDMLKRKFFEHAGPGGPSLQARLKRIRYRGSTAAENIAYGSNFNAKLVVQAWMNSPPHKANILSPGLRFLGVGIAVGIPVTPGRPGSTYTQDFGSTLK